MAHNKCLICSNGYKNVKLIYRFATAIFAYYQRNWFVKGDDFRLDRSITFIRQFAWQLKKLL